MSLERHFGKNVGSLGKLWVKLQAEVTDTNTPADTKTDGLTISADIIGTGVWTPIEIVPGESSWQEIPGNGDEPSYSFIINAVLHSDRQAVTEALHKLDGRKILAIAQDRNENLNRLIGEVGLFDYHANLSFTQVKEKTPGRNAYDITIRCEMHHPACYYSGAINE